MTPTEKQCSGCKIVKPCSEFSKDNNTRSLAKVRSKCKECERTYDRERQRRNYWTRHQTTLAQRKAWESRNRQAISERAAVRRRGSLKEKARRELRSAMERGEIVRPAKCEDCGIIAPPLHGHHDDYGKPLAVRWLCSRCHGNVHRMAA